MSTPESERKLIEQFWTVAVPTRTGGDDREG